jgi:fructoselysine-6-P-deglycase FrlB-like protein
MEQLLSHPMVITTYAVVLPSAIAAVVALFRRLGKVEARVERLDELMEEVRSAVKDQGDALVEALSDFRVHMAEEQANMKRLELTLSRLLQERAST